MWKFVGVACASILLAMVAPLMAAAEEGPALPAEFAWPPIEVGLLAWSDGGLILPLLAMAVLAAQYLLTFLLVSPVRPLLRRCVNAILRPLRQGLFRDHGA